MREPTSATKSNLSKSLGHDLCPCSELRSVVSEEEVGKQTARQEDELGGGGPDAWLPDGKI